MSEENSLLEISPFEIDGGELIGRCPADTPTEVLHQIFSEKTPLRAIRAKCIDCCVGQIAEVRKCVSTDCPLWPFRMGKNPFRKRMDLSEEERARRALRLQGARYDPFNEKPRSRSANRTGA